MNGQKRAAGTFDDRLLAFDEIQNIHAAVRIMRHGLREPMAPGLDEFALVQAGALLAPAVAAGDRFDAVDQIVLRPFGRAVPLDIGEAMFEMDRPRLAVETEPTPIPHLEGENIGRGADFQHHEFRAAAMHRAGRNQKMIVFLGGQFVGVFLRRKRCAAGLRGFQILRHRRADPRRLCRPR